MSTAWSRAPNSAGRRTRSRCDDITRPAAASASSTSVVRSLACRCSGTGAVISILRSRARLPRFDPERFGDLAQAAAIDLADLADPRHLREHDDPLRPLVFRDLETFEVCADLGEA